MRVQTLRALARDYSLLPRLFWTLWVGVLVNRIGVMVLPFLGLYLTSHGGLSPEQAGVVVGAYGVGQIGASWLGGVLADRVGRKRTMLIALVGGAALILVLSQMHGMVTTLCCVFALACFAELYRPAFGALIADIVPEHQRYLAYSANHWAINLGFAIAMIAGGMLARTSYALLFYVDAGTTLLYALLVALRMPETRPIEVPATRASKPDSKASAAASAGLLSDRRFMAFLALSFGLALVFSQATFTLPLYLKNIGLEVHVFGWLMAVNGVLIVLFQPLVVRLTRDTAMERVFLFAVLTQGVGFGLHGASNAAWVQLAAVVTWTCGEIATVPISGAIVASLAPASARGRYQGAYAAVWSLALTAGPMLGGLLVSHFGGTALWGGCLVFSVIIAALAVASGALRTAHDGLASRARSAA